MKVLPLVSLAAWSLLGLVLGCGKLLDIEEKQPASSGAGGAGGGGGQGAGQVDETCALADPGTAALRIMNAIPGAEMLDLCVKPSGNASFGNPWFLPRESSCGNGVGYTQYTRDLGIDAGTYDFKLIAAGKGCSTLGIELIQVALAERESVTLLAYGPSLDDGRGAVLVNRKPEGLNIPLRFVHALNAVSTLTAGLATAETEPVAFVAPIFVDVPFGGVADESSGGPTSVDDVLADGYTLYGGGETTRAALLLGVAAGDSAEISLTVPLPVAPAHAYTVFALGVSGSIGQRPRLFTCDESQSEGLFLKCGNPVDVAFEVFNPNLTDAFTSFVAERTGPAVEAIVNEATDVLCVAELYDPKIRHLVSSLDSNQFNYRVFSDEIPEGARGSVPLRQDGTPPEYAPTACPGEFAGLLDAFLQCGIAGECLAASDDGEHYVAEPGDSATACYYAHCQAEGAATILHGDGGQGVVCYMCALTHLASYESSEATYAACTTESAGPHLAFGGTTGLAVLSKYPLGEPELVPLPSTDWNRAAMRVPVTLPNGTVVDEWCGSLRFPSSEAELPYAGQYGEGRSGYPGVLIEQQYQAETLIEAVKAQRAATGTTALVGLVAYSGPGLEDADGDLLVYAQAPTTYELLDAVWPRLVAEGYAPACTFCGDAMDNPLNDGGPSSAFWSTHLFADGLSPGQVQSTERTFMEPMVAPFLGDGSTRTPVSQHFGLRSVVTISQ